MLKLPSRDLPTVDFKRDLPDYLGPKDETCFVSFKARAGGSVNPKHVELVEKSLLNARVMSRKASKIENDEAFVQADYEHALEIDKQRFAALFDACVISWDSNIQTEAEDGTMVNITCDRDTFLQLVSAKVPSITAALSDLEQEVKNAGIALQDEGKDTVKN